MELNEEEPDGHCHHSNDLDDVQQGSVCGPLYICNSIAGIKLNK